MDARVVRISIAPVKALGLVHPEEVEVEAGGVRGDRRFVLFDERMRLFNGKRHGPLVQVRPDWDEETRRLALTLPDGETVSGTVELGEPVRALMYGAPLPARRVVGPWEAAISEVVGQPLHLLWAEDGAVDRTLVGGTVSLVSQGSLERLGSEAGAARSLDGRRFRMLFEIDGVGAHEEDGWIDAEVAVGDAVLRVNGDVGRCVVTSHDPDRGVTDVDTLGALAAYRREGRNEPLPLGVYGSVSSPGRVRVGDPVRLLQPAQRD